MREVMEMEESEEPLESEESERWGREDTLAHGKELLSLCGFADKSRGSQAPRPRTLRRHFRCKLS